MKTIKKINLNTNEVTLSDGSIKYVDAYLMELEDRIIKAINKLPDTKPEHSYYFKGEELWEILDILENRK